MKRIFTSILIMALSFTAIGQITDNKEIYGKWKVERIVEKQENPHVKPLIDGFNQATFVFNENGNFELSTTAKSELFEMINQETKGTKWIFNQKNQSVRIGNKEDNYSIMSILIRENNGKILFHIDETGMTLEMKKIK